MKRYPRSFLQLVTFGHVLVVIPFLFVTGYVLITLDALSGHYHAAIEDVSNSSRLTSELTEDLVHMERSLRRYEVLKNADSLTDYAQVRAEWQGNAESLSRLPAMSEGVVSELQLQIQQENQAYEALLDTRNTSVLRSVIEDVKLRSHKVHDDVHEIISQEQAKFEMESDALRLRLLMAVGVAVLFAFCCIVLSRQLLSRLIGRFEKAVLGLGKGNLQQAIALDGPGDLRWLGRWLEWLRRRLLSLEETRTKVLRHVSHELKTPLAAMREGTNLLAEEVPGPLTVEQVRIVQILQSNSRRLEDLIEGLLRLQQAGHAAERIGFEPLRFDQLIEQVLETYRLIAAERQIEFHAVLPEVKIVAGREGLQTIVHNLLSNAVKFSPDGGRISIDLSTKGAQAFLNVSDEGPGIDTQDAGQIFEPFYRSSASRLVAGVGLGLAIAREFVLAHRGQLIFIESPQGGAHFRVVLPLEAPFVRVQQYA
ncbi:sensor histidine kinase [Propionivibrio sp.]|uniref:sensor histidine kinase n=1 Tax=Propionivibrio sp. TaxID=2212460 RepID=UPI003BF365F3